LDRGIADTVLATFAILTTFTIFATLTILATFRIPAMLRIPTVLRIPVWVYRIRVPVAVRTMLVLPFLTTRHTEPHQNEQAHQQAFHKSALPQKRSIPGSAHFSCSIVEYYDVPRSSQNEGIA
jgi:hypothetical protein